MAQGGTMIRLRYVPRALQAGVVALAAACAALPTARAQTAPATITDHGSLFIDGETFAVTPGKARPDAADRIKALGARELGPGAIIFREGNRLYLLGAPLTLERDGRGGSLLVDAERAQLGRIHVQYDPPKNPEHQQLYEMLKDNHSLEMVQQILSPFRLPVGLTIKTLGCDGLINAWYNTDNSVPTVHMCYELLQNIVKTTPMANIHADITQHDALVGQFLFWTLHETGHAMFEIYQVPLFGREEDSADLFAGYLMLQFGKDQARRFIEGAAFAAEEFMKDFSPMDNYASVHGLPQQRFYNLLCLAYGADPKLFADVANSMADKGFLPKRRADNCEYEFQIFDRAFKTAIEPYIDQQMAGKLMDTTWFPEPHPMAPR
jgi:hypothetical protein